MGYGKVNLDGTLNCSGVQKPGMVSLDLFEKDSNGNYYEHYKPEMVDGIYINDSEFLLNNLRIELLDLLKEKAYHISSTFGLNIGSDEKNPSRKMHSYKNKEDWAIARKKEIDNNELNIDYSPYEKQAARFNYLKNILNIDETDINKAYVEIILFLAKSSKAKFAGIEENEYRIEALINNASTLEELEYIRNNMEDELKLDV